MYPLSPTSGGSSAHLSPHPMSSRVQTFSPLSNPSPMTPSLRPPSPPLHHPLHNAPAHVPGTSPPLPHQPQVPLPRWRRGVHGTQLQQPGARGRGRLLGPCATACGPRSTQTSCQHRGRGNEHAQPLRVPRTSGRGRHPTQGRSWAHPTAAEPRPSTANPELAGDICPGVPLSPG